MIEAIRIHESEEVTLNRRRGLVVEPQCRDIVPFALSLNPA